MRTSFDKIVGNNFELCEAHPQGEVQDVLNNPIAPPVFSFLIIP